MAVATEELRAYAAQLQQGVIALYDAQLIDQVAAAYDVKASALAELGGVLGRDPERATESGGRVREEQDRLSSSYEAMVASPGEEWAVGNVLVGLGNLHIIVDSSVARSSCGSQYVWALPQLVEMGAARLVQREYARMRAVLEAEWLVCDTAETASRAIETLYAIPLPAGFERHDLHPTELPAMREELEQAFGMLDTPFPAGLQDDSVRAAEWLQFSTDGLEDGAQAGGPAGGQGEQPRLIAYPGDVVDEESTVETDIRIVQEQLRLHGYDIAVDGRYGRGTLEAVRQFQASQSLEPDGSVGPQTWSALFSGQV